MQNKDCSNELLQNCIYVALNYVISFTKYSGKKEKKLLKQKRKGKKKEK